MNQARLASQLLQFGVVFSSSPRVHYALGDVVADVTLWISCLHDSSTLFIRDLRRLVGLLNVLTTHVMHARDPVD